MNTTHDPLCLLNLSDCDHGNTHVCHCTLIARTKADLRAQIAVAIEAQAMVGPVATDDWENGFKSGLIDAARIARGGVS